MGALKNKISARPTYFDKFVCVADKCKHSCCSPGWEIDIDDESAARYRRMRGALGKELKENMQYTDGVASFKLREDGRCPFLNERGLCRLIIERGEDALCDICREHPRFYNILPYREEVGLGIYCEEVCRLVIEEAEPSKIIEDILPCYDGEYDEYTDGEIAFASELLSCRAHLLKTVTDAEHTFAERLASICHDCGISENDACQIKRRDILDFMLTLEPLDETWVPLINGIVAHFEELKADSFDEHEKAFENLTVYYLYRYYPQAFEGRYAPFAYVKFSLLSVRFIGIAAAYAGLIGSEKITLEKLADVARNYSDQIESSEENVDALLKRLSEC